MSHALIGMDLSLNHAGILVLRSNGAIAQQHYVVIEPNKEVSDLSVISHLLPKRQRQRNESREIYDMRRLDAWMNLAEALPEFFKETLRCEDIYIAIEGYAFAASSSSLTQTGGLIEGVKLQLLRAGFKLRTYDPLSIKFFITGKGNSSAEEVHEVVQRRYKYHPKATGDGLGDLCTALAIAKLLRLEVELKGGRIRASQLNKRELHVFKRVTKTLPIPIIERDWITLDE